MTLLALYINYRDLLHYTFISNLRAESSFVLQYHKKSSEIFEYGKIDFSKYLD